MWTPSAPNGGGALCTIIEIVRTSIVGELAAEEWACRYQWPISLRYWVCVSFTLGEDGGLPERPNGLD